MEKRFGGHVADKTKNFFPPREASYNYGFDKFRLEETKEAKDKHRRGSLKLGGVIMKSMTLSHKSSGGSLNKSPSNSSAASFISNNSAPEE